MMYTNDGREVGAHEIASEVALKRNLLLANMVFFCLNALQDSRVMAERSIEGSYFEDVFKQAEELDKVFGIYNRRRGVIPNKSPMGSGSTTPRSAGSGYMY